MGEIIALIIGVLGVAGLILTALRWRRDDTTAIVNQQGELFAEMKAITESVRLERDDLRIALEECVEASGRGR